MKPAEMTEGQLRAALAKAETLSSAICCEFIAAGRGHEKPSETRTKTDDLALRWRNASTYSADLLAEKARRMEWHGSLKRIRANRC